MVVDPPVRDITIIVTVDAVAVVASSAALRVRRRT
jgi:hypothetical protein